MEIEVKHEKDFEPEYKIYQLGDPIKKYHLLDTGGPYIMPKKEIYQIEKK